MPLDPLDHPIAALTDHRVLSHDEEAALFSAGTWAPALTVDDWRLGLGCARCCYRYRDLARPAVLLVHCAGAMGLGFGTVVIPDTETEVAADSTAAALRVICCVVITRARERGRPWVGRAAGCRVTWGWHG